MSNLYNIYCDESCHLEHKKITDEDRYMVLGGVMCPNVSKEAIFSRIKAIKQAHGLSQRSEMKWTKISNGKLSAYKDLINYFFDNSDLSFRAIVIDKTLLDHERFEQTHDQFYYKMYWQMLGWFIDPANHYQIYLDIKDTQGYIKVEKLHECLSNSHYDFDKEVVRKIQEVRSHEIAVLQLTDILIGAISYVQRYGENGQSEAKKEIISLIKQRSGLTLERSTSLGARKLNIFCWEGQKN